MDGKRVITENPPNIGAGIGALTGDPVGQDRMYVRCNLPVPEKPPAGFELVVPGADTRFVTPETLRTFETVTTDVVLECAGNGRTLMASPIPDGTPWDLDGVSPITVHGVRLADVVGELPDGAVEMVFTGADAGVVDGTRMQYQFSISRQLAESPVPILATHIGGEPLRRLHGGPIRLVVPGHYAMKSVKWLVKVEAVSQPFRGHFVEKYRYYGDTLEAESAPVGEIAVRSVIASPSDGAVVEPGVVEIRGSAWSGSAEVTRVEVSVDGGDTWAPATIEPGVGRWAPVPWVFHVEVTPGRLEVMSRASDAARQTQPLEPRWNGNGYANNVVQRVGVEVVGG